MKTLLLCLTLNLLTISNVIGQDESEGWLLSLENNYGSYGWSVCSDSEGNIYSSGTFMDTLYVDGISQNYTLVAQERTMEMFIQKMNAAGEVIWAITFGGMRSEKGLKIKLDKEGNLYMIGNFYGDLRVDGEALVVSEGGSDIFLAKFSPEGKLLWLTSKGKRGDDIGYDISFDNENNVFLTGTFSELPTYDHGVPSYEFHIVIAKYSNHGLELWTREFGEDGFNVGCGIECDESGSAFITGYFSGEYEFDEKGQTIHLKSNGEEDAFVMKLDKEGTIIWAKNIGSKNTDKAHDIALDSEGNILIAGEFSEILVVKNEGLDSTVTLTGDGFVSSFVQKLNGDGETIWTRKLESSQYVLTWCLDVDRNDHSFVVGIFSKLVPEEINNEQMDSSYSIQNNFIYELDSDNNMVWSSWNGADRIDPENYDKSKLAPVLIYYDICVGANGSILATGCFQGKCELNITKSKKATIQALNDCFFVQKISY